MERAHALVDCSTVGARVYVVGQSDVRAIPRQRVPNGSAHVDAEAVRRPDLRPFSDAYYANERRIAPIFTNRYRTCLGVRGPDGSCPT